MSEKHIKTADPMIGSAVKRYSSLLFEVSHAALEQRLILDTVNVGAAISRDTLAVTHFTEDTGVRRDYTLDSVHRTVRVEA